MDGQGRWSYPLKQFGSVPHPRLFIAKYFVALTFLGSETLAPTIKIFRSSSGSLVEVYGILQNVSVQHKDVEASLDFYVFEVPDFDLLIGHPIEMLFLDVPRLGNLDIKLGKDSSISIF
jgi:hypothetical protein